MRNLVTDLKNMKIGLNRFLLSYNSVVILLILCFFGTFFIDGFNNNISTIIFDSSIYGFMAVALGIIMVTGNIDLSVGFQAAGSAVTTVIVLDGTGSLFLAVVSALCVAVLMGCINGFTVVKLGISPLIATIATNYIYKGYVYFFTKTGAYYPQGELRDLLKSSFSRLRFFDLKILSLTIIIFILLIVLFMFLMRKTNFGNAMYIAGDNGEAGVLSGINIKRVSFLAYVVGGFLCGIAGIFLASNSGAAMYTQGEGRDIFAVSACVIGGIKMAGGKGTLLNILLGILIMRVISTGMNLMMIPSSWVDFVSGVLIIFVLVIDRITSIKKEE